MLPPTPSSNKFSPAADSVSAARSSPTSDFPTSVPAAAQHEIAARPKRPRSPTQDLEQEGPVKKESREREARADKAAHG
ncbi:hypothetical protein NLJ89_g10897 [Agrocybe chaxingu]|uniref:Uncharacterized protein n=1 Tax=Agrocybe chaxingu TaxID=84603 RepID=A0A9W8JXS7_9AGAR|nr:hypothetical protein NLJ89_g10897 [Agrocybe chaxingu]